MLYCSAVQREEDDNKERLMLAGKLGVYIYIVRETIYFLLCIILFNPHKP